MGDVVILADEAHREAMTASSRMLLHVIQGHRVSPSDLRWGSGIPKNQWPTQEASGLNSRLSRERLRMIQEKNKLADSLRVDPREPCTFCGVRADAGCRHRRVA